MYTLKQVSVCCLGLADATAAKKALSEAKEILEGLPKDDSDKTLIERDLEEISSIEGQVYVASLLDKDLEQAVISIDYSIECLGKIVGPKSARLSSKYYQKATTLQMLGRFPEAIEAIKSALDLHYNPVELKKE